MDSSHFSFNVAAVADELRAILNTFPMKGGCFSPVWRTNNKGWYMSRFSLWFKPDEPVTSTMPETISSDTHFPKVSQAASDFLAVNDDKYSALEVRIIALYPNRAVQPHNDGAKFNVAKGGTMDRYFVPVIHPKGCGVFVEGKALDITVGVPVYLEAWKMHHTENNHPSQLRMSLLFDGVLKNG